VRLPSGRALLNFRRLKGRPREIRVSRLKKPPGSARTASISSAIVVRSPRSSGESSASARVETIKSRSRFAMPPASH
jgi:hypothetical protein